ncbi:hypothetical protein A374_06136 [Fictibacillus macauensis ZFHKF-1]|uniref:ATP-grasp domain-containing protein n=1 Tax=Fictibacillus macauensis ZFHKF-1 TaxID=1196324 RepID=I8UGX7_9BACL|nr:ATP-grasp domain-containing protein [Fictibacillus macauensis]EIT86155.1 hypothetical protein A374_06136 [Fictibacillus macauensis ZFHKF-1]
MPNLYQSQSTSYTFDSIQAFPVPTVKQPEQTRYITTNKEHNHIDQPLVPRWTLASLANNHAAFRDLLSTRNAHFFYWTLPLPLLQDVNPTDVPYPVILKTNRTIKGVPPKLVTHRGEWHLAIESLIDDLFTAVEHEISWRSENEAIVIEQWQEGPEYIVNGYFKREGEPIPLSIITKSPSFSLSAIQEELSAYLSAFSLMLQASNSPFHMTMRQSNKGIEAVSFSPYYFASCGSEDVKQRTTDAYLAGLEPSWSDILVQRHI